MSLASPDPRNQQFFRARRPLRTHWRPATCEEMDCPHYLNGWRTILPVDDPRADYIRHRSGRSFKEKRNGDMVEFTFSAGQTCFSAADHKRLIGRPDVFERVPRLGAPALVHARPEDWVENMEEELDATRRTIEKG